MIVLITLLGLAAFAVHGIVPGTTESATHSAPPSAVSVALMPVLLMVSVVVLLAGVIASQHRLPLSMPEPERDGERQPWRLGRGGLVTLGVLALLALVLTVVAALWFLNAGRDTEIAPPPPASTTGAPPDHTPAPAPDSTTTPELTGPALTVAALAAAALVAMAVAGLTAVGVQSRRRKQPEAPPVVESAPETMVDSLTRAAEMGLAAMNVPGQDPRTAIIACYGAMERGLASDRSAAPLDSDTPMEVLARAFERGALRDASARELVALFEEARFSPHSMLEWQRMRAQQLLRIVLADLQGEERADARTSV
ncbi:DUF4129 domain-containing protein [Nocardia callitridis]|uniref:DUF4129 domain-containing protein n=1 Tax=Nocardia callitridis TaxID=648753 RepID=A0ABP9K2Y9_9NOCA